MLEQMKVVEQFNDLTGSQVGKIARPVARQIRRVIFMKKEKDKAMLRELCDLHFEAELVELALNILNDLGLENLALLEDFFPTCSPNQNWLLYFDWWGGRGPFGNTYGL